MAKIKSFSDLQQSKKLAKILPLESADMIWVLANPDLPMIKAIAYEDSEKSKYYEILPAWSLAALLGVLPKEIVHNKNIVFLELHVWENSLEYVNNANYTLCVTESYDNPIDACVEMIIRLNELKML